MGSSPKVNHEAPAPDVTAWLADAVNRRASDVHIEPTATRCEWRVRVDGLLHTVTRLEPTAGRACVNRLMVMAKLLTYRLDIPQEGCCQLELPSDDEGSPHRQLDLRVSVMPTNHGLRAVVRLPADLTQPRGIDQLGLPTPVLDGLKRFAAGDSGMLLFCGPAGSGKTTATYALLEHLAAKNQGLSVVSLEDPIERDLPGVTQVQVAPFGELTYERALRSMLRQDPQVLALGEVRDAATATVAVQAALSGHRLVSTLHAASPSGAIVRLLEMGVERYQAAGALAAVVSIRLLRRTTREGTPAGSDGYRGRVPVASIGWIDERVRAAVLGGGGLDAIETALGTQSGCVSLHETAQQLVADGQTDTAEVHRVLGRQPSTPTTDSSP